MNERLLDQPCPSCPYRRDVPSGIWAREEYEKLRKYDAPTGTQPFAAFFCHHGTGHLCAGWVGCHDMDNSLGLRMAASSGAVDIETYQAALHYTSPVPLFGSGNEAADHGEADLENPSDEAVEVVARLIRKQARKGGSLPG